MLWTCCVCLLWSAPLVLSDGLLLLYRPRDISSECVNSQHLRYDLSFGMGMSDTITLVFRTLSNLDYECEVEVSTESTEIHLLVVIRFPNNVAHNCAYNRNAFTILEKNKCQRLCDMVGQRDFLSPYYTITLQKRICFRFISNSSVNFDINANLYQVTATAARIAPPGGCSRRNETPCRIYSSNYCFTSGVVCDGINNCGVADWFDERKSQCSLPVEKLGFAPVVAVLAAVLCTLLVIGRGILYCLPSTSASFFIFNANEDNRLCIDTVFKSPDPGRVSSDTVVRTSIIPVFSDSSTESNKSEEVKVTVHESETVDAELSVDAQAVKADSPRRISERNITMRSVTATLGRKLRNVTGHHRGASNAIALVKDIPAPPTTQTL